MVKPYPYFISLEEANSLSQNVKLDISSEDISISQSLHRVVSSDVKALVNDPRFDNSSMDCLLYTSDAADE